MRVKERPQQFQPQYGTERFDQPGGKGSAAQAFFAIGVKEPEPVEPRHDAAEAVRAQDLFQ
ncbi:MAG: hypothetical protein PVI39_08595, partial [Desulfobacteraceae bacterium]